MNKTAIKNFAVWARNKLIADITYKAGLIGVSGKGIAQPLPQSSKDLQFFDIGTKDYAQVAGTEIGQRNALVRAIQEKECTSDYKTAFEAVIEEVAYTWFNRLIAIRFMEVNEYLPSRIRVLSSENSAKNEPDFVTTPFDTDMEFTMAEQDRIMQLKDENKLDELFRMLFIKQCNKLHEILPGLFEETNNYTELLLSLSFTDSDGIVYHLVHDIEEEDFDVDKEGQVEIIGWMYQYYNTELKDETFALLKKNVKITKERIPAVTQLFTPDWIVRYMVENSLGRLWVEGHPSDSLKENWKYYLEEAEQEVSVQAQLERIRAEYGNLTPEDIKVIDPCMGSGHILVYCFDVLMQIYESQGYTQRDAVKSILENNLYGLDIDKRAAQLAYFAVMMKARQYDRRIFAHKNKPNVYAIEESNGVNRGHLKYFGVDLSIDEKNNAMSQITDLLDSLTDAKEYGSILSISDYRWDLLHSFVASVDTAGQMTLDTIGIEKTQSDLNMLIKVSQIMTQKYHSVITNPPYMGSSGMGSKLLNYVKVFYPDSKSDFFSIFIEKCAAFTKTGGYYGMITQPSFLFLSSFEKLRRKILTDNTISSLLHLGRGIFGIDFGSTAFVIRQYRCDNYVGSYFKLHERTFQYIDPDDIANLYIRVKENKDFRYDFTEYDTQKGITSQSITSAKALKLYYEKEQRSFNKIPGLPIAYWAPQGVISAFETGVPLGELTVVRNGMKTGDNGRFLRLWWEVQNDRIMFNAYNVEEAFNSGKKWFPYNKGGETRKWYGNNDYVVNWENKGAVIFGQAKTDGRNVQDYPADMKFIPSGTWSLISAGKPTFRYKECNLSDIAGMSFYRGGDKTKYYLGFCNTPIAAFILQMLAPTINYQAGDIARLPIYYEASMAKSVDELVSDNIRIAKDDWDSHETSWDFQKHPLLELSNAGLLSEAYLEWEKLCSDRKQQMLENEKKLNEMFLELYKLDGEIAQSIEEDITLKVPNPKEDIRALISYSVGCMFGRYSLDESGVLYAGGEWDSGKYRSFIPDKDNCIPITDEEYFKDDIVGLFVEWIRIAFGTENLEINLDFIAKTLGNKGVTSREIIRNYFLNDFMKDHIKIYQKRPIYWLFDSGKQNGFKALVYMHRWNADTVGNLRVEYLHKTQHIYECEITRMQEIIDSSRDSREISKAIKRKDKLQKQLKETKDYDAKLAHIALSRIEIDLDDGVKANYEKVQTGRDGKKMQILAKI